MRKDSLTQPKDELIVDEMSEKIVATAEQLATAGGAHTVTVRKILQTLGITNRVFYNRFRNVDEVLEIVYRDMIVKVRRDIVSEYDGKQDFFEYVKDVVEKSLLITYDNKMRFNQFMFESDSHSTSNYMWWTGEIKKLIEYAKAHNLIRNVDSDVLSYSIWCFCRGYNADAVGRQIPRDEAVKNFRYSFGFLLDGLKK
ncbi:MAG: TetR/AcrR family transcriptional regulator [Clostridia bacterium]|nr:TetR/AcrR family transcriptional regulator [Clostridia bacterium]